MPFKDAIKEYFRWHVFEKKPVYDFEEVLKEFEIRREKRFQNLLSYIYYWFHRNFEWIWKPYIVAGYIERAWQIITRPDHWSDKDIWSLDHTVAKFTLPRLIRLKEVKHGIPTTMFETLPEGKWEYTEEQTDAAKKKWDEVLDKMIWSMDYIANDREHDYYPKRSENKKEGAYDNLHAAEFRCQEGLDLFAKHFRSLWD